MPLPRAGREHLIRIPVSIDRELRAALGRRLGFDVEAPMEVMRAWLELALNDAVGKLRAEYAIMKRVEGLVDR